MAWLRDKGEEATGPAELRMTPTDDHLFTIRVTGALGTLQGSAQVTQKEPAILHAKLRLASSDAEKQKDQTAAIKTSQKNQPINHGFSGLLSVFFDADTKSATATIKASDASAKTVRAFSAELQRRDDDCLQ